MRILFLVSLAFVQAAEAAVTWDTECGVTKGCFPNCQKSGCSYLVTWQVPTGQDSVKFEIFVEESGTFWVGVAFSSDDHMGADSGVACLTSNNDVITFYNAGYTTSELSSPNLGISSTSLSQANGITSCSFTRSNTANSDTKYYDLKTDYYLMLGTGPLVGNTMTEHRSDPKVSSVVVDFQSTDIVGESASLEALIKLHAITMVLAWHLFSAVAIVIARYQRKMLSEKEVLGAKIWFQLHRLLMILVAVFVLIGFIAIFVKKGELEIEEDAAHPIMGIIIFCLTLINPTMALIRPGPDHKRRFIFNWAHRIVGVVAHILAIVVIFLGFDFDEMEDVDDGAKNASYAHIAIHSAIMLVLEGIKWWTHFKDDEEKPNDKIEMVNQILMVVHAVAMFATTIAIIVIIGKT